jgi:hypothetical protein
MKKILNFLSISFIAISLLVITANQSRNLFLNFSEPVIFDQPDPYASPSTIKPGDPLTVVYTFDRNRYCSTDLSYFIFNLDTNRIVWSERIPGGSQLVGKNIVVKRDIVIKNPENLPIKLIPGNYELRLLVYSNCSDGLHIMPAKDIKFIVKAQ